MAKQKSEMLTHDQIWRALDRLAERAGLSASGLAKKSGLDPTTFNKSKRVTPEGRPPRPPPQSVRQAPPPLAVARSGRQGARRHQRLDRHLLSIDRGHPAHGAVGAAARLCASRL